MAHYQDPPMYAKVKYVASSTSLILYFAMHVINTVRHHFRLDNEYTTYVAMQLKLLKFNDDIATCY